MTSGIEWTEDTWNPLTGCSIASDGCTNCYAAREAAGRLSGHPAYQGLAIRNATTGVAEFTGEVRQLPDRLRQPIKWQRPRLVFVNSMSDLFHPQVPTEYIAQVVAHMAVAHWHIFQVLTKRPKRMQLLLSSPEFVRVVSDYAAMVVAPQLPPARRAVLEAAYCGEQLPWPLPNIWWGTSVEDQANAELRLSHLLDTPAAVRWVSAEPLLGPLDLTDWLVPDPVQVVSGAGPVATLPGRRGLDWVVVGGESGPGARPMHPDWVRELRAQCSDTRVPFLFKQWGEWAPGWPGPGQHAVAMDAAGATVPFDSGDWRGDDITWQVMTRVGKKAAGRSILTRDTGGTVLAIVHDGYPPQLAQVRA